LIGLYLLFASISKKYLLIHKEKTLIFLLILSSQIGLGARIDPSDFLIFGVLLFILVNVFVDTSYKIRLPASLLFLALLFFAVLSLISGGSILMLPSLVKLTVVFFLIANLIRTKEHCLFTIKVFIVITTCSAIIGIVQEIIFLTTGATLVGFIPPQMRDQMYESTPWGIFLRIPAMTGWYEVLSNCIIISILLGINLLLYPIIIKKNQRLLMYSALFIMSMALLLTFSKSALLSLILGVILSIFIKWKKLAIHFLMALLALVIFAHLAGLFDILAEYVTSDISLGGEMGDRVNLIKSGIQGFFKHPLLGVGIGSGARYTQTVRGWPVHNIFILIADEIGIFGLVIFLLIVLRLIVKLLYMISTARNDGEKGIITASLISLIALIVNLQVHPSYKDYFIFMIFGIFEAVALMTSEQANRKMILPNNS
jgi:putative inorganic carbon (HCO3(-)) transporter